jgi:hypothetical protein
LARVGMGRPRKRMALTEDDLEVLAGRLLDNLGQNVALIPLKEYSWPETLGYIDDEDSFPWG